MHEALAAVFGLIAGSFLNVCIHRWPRDESVVRPRSRCPECEHPIAWFDNIPIVSWILLRGRCRHCQAPISIRYPLVELLTAAVFVWFIATLGFTPSAVRYCVFCAMLIALGFSDLETFLLPDELTLGGVLIGFVFAAFVPVPDTTAHLFAYLFHIPWGPRALSIAEALIGAVIPAGFLWLGGALFEKIRGKEGLGFGDVKMMAMAGAFLGLRGTLFMLLAGSLLGSIIGLAYIKITKKDAGSYHLPMGTFLAIGGIFVAVAGNRALEWYMGRLK